MQQIRYPGKQDGRKPKNLQQKKIDGSPRINHNEPDFEKVTDIACPDWIGPQGRAVWELYAPQLCKTRVLAVTDVHNLELFCAAYQSWREAQSELAKYGPVIENDKGNLVKNPASTVVNESSRQVAMYGTLLGLDPSSRTRLTGIKPDVEKNPFGELDEAS